MSVASFGQVGAITGATSLCPGSTATLSDTTTGGTWSSSNPAIATVDSSGTVSGVSVGTVTISYVAGTGTATTTVSVNGLPTAYSVTGGGGYCAGGTGVTIGLSNSQTGVAYSLFNGTSVVGTPVIGTGSPMSFGLYTAGGTYTVVATYGSPCAVTMTGSATITVNPLPTTYPVTGGGSYCSGGTGVSVGLSSSAIGINYQLYTGGTFVIGAAGTGSSLNFGNQTATGTYTVSAVNATTGCAGTMTGSATVSVNPLPSVHTITGGGGYCAGGTGVTIGLNGSDTSITYQLFLGTTTVGAPVSGTGSTISFGSLTSVGTYTVSAVNIATTCVAGMAGSATVTVNPQPTAFTVTGGSYCSGGSGVHVTLSGSQAATTYILDSASIPVTSHGGTGGAIDFGLHQAGTYSINAINSYGCTALMGTAAVSVNPLPVAYSVTGGGTYCSGGVGTHIGLAGSNIGANYQLYRGGVPVGVPVAGTAGSLDFGAQTVTGTYSVTATYASTGCSGNMTGSATISVTLSPAAIGGTTNTCPGNSRTLTDITPGGVWSSSNTLVATIGTSGTVTGISSGVAGITYTVGGCSASTNFTVNPLPSAYPVTGGGSYCTGGIGVDVSLAGSDPGLNYQLYNGSTTSGVAIAGTGGVLDFGLRNTAGTYTVKASNPTTGCTAYMTGSVIINIVSPPAVYTITGGGGYCPSGSGVHVGLSGSQLSVSYQLYNSGVPVGGLIAGTGLPLDFGPQTATGTYTVVGNNSYCNANMAGSVYVSLYGTPTPYSVTGGGNYCAGGSGVHIGIGSSQTGVSYHLFDGTSLVDTALGTGGAVDFGLFTGVGTYTVTAVNLSTTCASGMSGNATVGTNALPTAYTITGGGSYCAGGTGVHIGLSGSALGVSYQLYNGMTPVTTVSGTSSALDFGPQTGAGSYTVVATNTTTSCVNNMSGGVTISITPTVSPVVSIISSPGDTVCSGTAVTFTAIPVNGGPTPLYQWSINGVLVATGAAYTYLPVSGDIVGVRLNSSALCAVPSSVATSVPMTVKPHPVITGDTVFCVGSNKTLVSSPGATWISSNMVVASIATVGSSTGVVTPYTAGTTVITCTLSGCTTSETITVNPLPAVSLAAATSCGGTTTLTAGGAISYTWSPASGLSCTACTTTIADPSSTTTYTVTGSLATGCSDTASVLIDANRISGYISYGGVSDTFRVRLFQINASDTSLIAEDSVLSCSASGTPYYEFMDMPAGNYMVSATRLAPASDTGYAPTYSLQSTHWGTAQSIIHSSAKDTMHINMVPCAIVAGSGFINGNIATAVGISGFTPASGILVLLEDASNIVRAFTYTDASGNYDFSNIAYGSYYIYPEEFSYHTIPSTTVTLSSTTDSATKVDFRRYTSSRIILPYLPVGVKTISSSADFTVYPNPAGEMLHMRWSNLPQQQATIIISDMMGREVYRSGLSVNTMDGETEIGTENLSNGIYSLSIRSDEINYSTKLVIAR